MPRVLFVTTGDPAADFAGSVLFRPDVERLQARDAATAIQLAGARLPNLIVVRDDDGRRSETLVRQLKERYETRRIPICVHQGPGAPPDDIALRRAGASLVLAMPVDPLRWDDRLEELMSEPRRREVRLPVRFVLWPRPAEGPDEGVALNISERGMLLETERPLAIGVTLEMLFSLPGLAAELQVVGQVVRQAEGQRLLYGVDFIILRGEARDRINELVESETRA